MGVAEGAQRRARASCSPSTAARAGGELLLVGEVRPPQQRAQGQAEQRARRPAPRRRAGLGADAHRDDRLAERDDDDEAVALHEVGRATSERPTARSRGATHSRTTAAPRAPMRVAAGDAAREHEGAAPRFERRQRGMAARPRGARCEEPACERDDEDVAQPEGRAGAVEVAGIASASTRKPRRRRQRQQAVGAAGRQRSRSSARRAAVPASERRGDQRAARAAARSGGRRTVVSCVTVKAKRVEAQLEVETRTELPRRRARGRARSMPPTRRPPRTAASPGRPRRQERRRDGRGEDGDEPRDARDLRRRGSSQAR